MEQSENILIATEIFARENNVPIRALYKLSLVCKELNSRVQWRLNERARVYAKWAPSFRTAVEKYLRKRIIKHPMEYTGKHTRVVSVCELIPYDADGIRILNFDDRLVSSIGVTCEKTKKLLGDKILKNISSVNRYVEFKEKNQLALTNICFMAHCPIPFLAMLIVGGQPIVAAQITSEDYIDRGLTYEERNKLRSKWGIYAPGGYFVDLKLQTRINPIIIREGIVHPSMVKLAIANSYITTGDGELTDMIHDPKLFMDNFTHEILHYDVVSEYAYDWSKYAATYNSNYSVNDHANWASFIRHVDDPGIDRTGTQPAGIKSVQPAQFFQFTGEPPVQNELSNFINMFSNAVNFAQQFATFEQEMNN